MTFANSESWEQETKRRKRMLERDLGEDQTRKIKILKG